MVGNTLGLRAMLKTSGVEKSDFWTINSTMMPFQRSRFSFGTHRKSPESSNSTSFTSSQVLRNILSWSWWLFPKHFPPSFARKQLCFVEKKNRRGRQNTGCDCVFIFFRKKTSDIIFSKLFFWSGFQNKSGFHMSWVSHQVWYFLKVVFTLGDSSW